MVGKADREDDVHQVTAAESERGVEPTGKRQVGERIRHRIHPGAIHLHADAETGPRPETQVDQKRYRRGGERCPASRGTGDGLSPASGGLGVPTRGHASRSQDRNRKKCGRRFLAQKGTQEQNADQRRALEVLQGAAVCPRPGCGEPSQPCEQDEE